MKENYEAWKIDLKAFDDLKSEKDKLKFLIRFAVLAPSSHNTQPWSFEVDGNRINVFGEHNRKLPIADNNDRQHFISIGCAIQNIILAAGYYGYETVIKYEIVGNVHKTKVAEIILTKSEKHSIQKDTELVGYILTRRTNRNRYLSKEIDAKIIKELHSVNVEGVSLFVTQNTEQVRELGQVAVFSSIESMIDKGFRHELSHHLKHNLTKSKTGMPGFSLGLPTPVSFLLPSMMKLFNMEKLAQKQNEDLFNNHTPYIALLLTEGDSFQDWVQAGRCFEYISLILTKYGISNSPWGAPVQIGGFFKDLQEIVGTDKRPQMFFRMGYSNKIARISPRIPYNDLIK